MRETVNLGGIWKLKGTSSFVPLRDRSMETGKQLEGITGWIDARVPGGVTKALYDAGYIEHPYVDMNSLKCEWVENRWWIYRREFSALPMNGHKKAVLHFEGVDYSCMVYLNGRLLGEHTGMYEDFSFDITGQYTAEEHFVLDVLILHAPDEMGQIGRTSLTSTQKSRFNYKWDFSTRLVNLGIWQDVRLELEDEAAIKDLDVRTDVAENGEGIIYAGFDINTENTGLCAEAAVLFEGNEIARKELTAYENTFKGEIRIESPELWYPNGCGKQPLYQVQLTLKRGNVLLDRRVIRQGIRRLELIANEGAPAEALPYTVRVNGKRMYIKGANVTPLDHIYGDVSRERVMFQLSQAARMNVNLVRVWGGGLIETEQFYDICDELGILIWQEFIQSSSGVDNIPSELPGFLELLSKAAVHALKVKRNHTALAAWSGGNELIDENKKPQTLKNHNIAMLAELVRQLDPSRFFYPTSPSGPESHISSQPDMSHDVHGWWQYQGNPRQYSYFGETDSLLHSEFGCDGMSCLRTVGRQLSKMPEKPVRMTDDDTWRFHGDWWCTYDREETMFGHTESIEKYIGISQWMQSEGLRFILEANRRRQWRNSGSIIWQLSEPWPNLSCTSLIDYYGIPKQAYYSAKQAFSALHASLEYKRLDYAPGEKVSIPVWLSCDNDSSTTVKIKAEIFALSGTLLNEQTFVSSGTVNGSVRAGVLCFKMPNEKMILVRLTCGAEINEYWFSSCSEKPYAAALEVNGAQLSAGCREVTGDGAVVVAVNNGSVPALNVFIEDASDEWNLTVDENFRTLLPGESAVFTVRWSARFETGFDCFEDRSTVRPVLQLRGIGIDDPIKAEVI